MNIDAVKTYLIRLQDSVFDALKTEDPEAQFVEDRWTRKEGGGGRSRVMTNGSVFEKAGIGFSHVRGEKLPPAATSARPELSGCSWQAMGVSVVIHPKNPHVPIAHANVRFFRAENENKSPTWCFVGCFDLTPVYPVDKDCCHFHQVAKGALDPFGSKYYSIFKANCDDYFYLPHRQETRGVGGLFFDDFNELGFEKSFELTQAVGNSFVSAYLPIVARRKADNYTAKQREFQLYRRGRYVEFNLVHDRGTLFGLQSGGRTESILMSMPPLVRWEYGYEAPVDSLEANLQRYLVPREWV